MHSELFPNKFTFFNIIPFSPGIEEAAAADAIEYTRLTGNREVLYSLSLHPQGRPAMKKAQFLLESYRKFKAALAGSDVRPGVLIQSILGHWPRVDKDEEQWTRTINIDGQPVRFCSFDKEYEQFIFEVAVMVAREKPFFILGDDDIRSFSPRVECFCPLHTAEFNRRTGNNFTPDEYREAVRNSKPGDAVFTAFEELRQYTVNNVASIIRRGIDSVDPAIPAGTCMPGWEYRFNGDTSKCMAGTHPPVMRICNANYQEGSAKVYPAVAAKTQALRQAHADIPYVLDEADTFPHCLYSRSSKSMHAKLCSSIIAGLKGAKLWLVNAHKFGKPVHKNYTEILARHRNFYQVFAGEVEKTVPAGVAIPVHKNFPKWHPVPGPAPEHFLEEPTFASLMLGLMGFPFQCTTELDKDAVYAVAGEKAAARFTDDELRTLLSGRVLLDGPAAAEVCKRGFAGALGVSAEMADFRYNSEYNLITGQQYAMPKTAGVPRLIPISPDIEVITELQYAPFVGSKDIETAAPATVIHHNDFGGTVCTISFHQAVPNAQFNEPRKEWLTDILERLGSETPSCTDLQDITAFSRRYGDGSWLFALCNINFDDMEHVGIRVPGKVTGVEYLTPEGRWEPVPFTVSGNCITVEKSMRCYEFAVFKLV